MDRLDFPPKLLNRFTFLYNFVGSADAKPTDGSHERFEDLKPELAKRVARLQEVIETELPAFNTLILQSDVAPVIVTDLSLEGTESANVFRMKGASKSKQRSTQICSKGDLGGFSYITVEKKISNLTEEHFEKFVFI